MVSTNGVLERQSYVLVDFCQVVFDVTASVLICTCEPRWHELFIWLIAKICGTILVTILRINDLKLILQALTFVAICVEPLFVDMGIIKALDSVPIVTKNGLCASLVLAKAIFQESALRTSLHRDWYTIFMITWEKPPYLLTLRFVFISLAFLTEDVESSFRLHRHPRLSLAGELGARTAWEVVIRRDLSTLCPVDLSYSQDVILLFRISSLHWHIWWLLYRTVLFICDHHWWFNARREESCSDVLVWKGTILDRIDACSTLNQLVSTIDSLVGHIEILLVLRPLIHMAFSFFW